MKPNTQAQVVTMQSIADDLGLPLATVNTYRKRSERHRRAGQPRPGDLPPATMVGRTPTWTVEVYQAWKAARPGRGAPGLPRARQ